MCIPLAKHCLNFKLIFLFATSSTLLNLKTKMIWSPQVDNLKEILRIQLLLYRQINDYNSLFKFVATKSLFPWKNHASNNSIQIAPSYGQNTPVPGVNITTLLFELCIKEQFCS